MTKLLALALLTTIGCASEVDGAPVFGSTYAIAPASANLRERAAHAADRLEASTGIHVDVLKPGDAVPEGTRTVDMFWSDRGVGTWWGRCAGGVIEVGTDTPADVLDVVVLHEMIHALNVAHVAEYQGVMAPHPGWVPDALTAVDLEAICSVQTCTAFAPER